MKKLRYIEGCTVTGITIQEGDEPSYSFESLSRSQKKALILDLLDRCDDCFLSEVVSDFVQASGEYEFLYTCEDCGDSVYEWTYDLDSEGRYSGLFDHPFNEEMNSVRLLEDYKKYDEFYVGLDFDNTIRPIDPEKSCDAVINLIRECCDLPKFKICLWSLCSDGEEELKEKLEYCKSLGIRIDYINDSPIMKDLSRKPFFSLLLDDRAGLESAYNCLQYIVNYVKRSR